MAVQIVDTKELGVTSTEVDYSLEFNLDNLDPKTRLLFMRLGVQGVVFVMAQILSNVVLEAIQERQNVMAVHTKVNEKKTTTLTEKIEKTRLEAQEDVQLEPGQMWKHVLIKGGIGLGIVLAGQALALGGLILSFTGIGALVGAPMMLIGMAAIVVGGAMIAGAVHDGFRLDWLGHEAQNPEASPEERALAQEDLKKFGTEEEKKDPIKGWGVFEGMPFYNYKRGSFVINKPDGAGARDYSVENDKLNNASRTENSQAEAISTTMKQLADLLVQTGQLFDTVVVKALMTWAKIGAN